MTGAARVPGFAVVAMAVVVAGIGTASAQDAGTTPAPSFIQLSAGMGVDEISTGGISGYINALANPVAGQELSGFATAVEFFVAPEARVTRDWSVGFEYSYMLKTFTVTDPSGLGVWDFATSVQLPSVLVHYLVAGDGYLIKAGGGPGYYLGRMVQSTTLGGGAQTYTARGPGLKLEVIANTEFDENFWGSISGDLRWCDAGTLVDGAGHAAAYGGNTAKLNFVSAGIKFGVTFQF